MAAHRTTKEILQQTIDAVATHGSVAAGSRALGISYGTFRSRYDEARLQQFVPQVQAQAGWAAANPLPEGVAPSNAVAEGYRLRGVSTLVAADGSTVQQWIKTERDALHAQAMQEAAFKALSEELTPIKLIKAPARLDKALATLYTMTDCHVGMLAWDKEAGEDWDLLIAERTLVSTFFAMIDAAPKSAVGIVNQLGDFLHFDSLQPLTPTSKHLLDADSRYQKVVEVAVRVLRRVIEYALAKHETVQVFMHEGNHDPAGSVWLRIMFAQLYLNNPRVVVEKSPNPYVMFKHGRTFLGFHHGHLGKKPGMPLLFAAKFPEAWGETDHRYIHMGHLHNQDEKEYPGIKVIQHPTLAAADAYAARYGWLSTRQASSMTYDVKDGEVARGTFVPRSI
jgi:hypothetical protein